MQTKRKANSVITHALAGDLITFTVGEKSFDLLTTTLDVEIRKQAMFHGLVQKISDRAAIGRDPETGASASPEEKFTAMKECAERLQNGGPWNVVSTGGGANAGGLLYRAMKAIYPNAWSDRTAFAAYIVQKAISESERLGKKVTESDVRAGLMVVKRIAKEVERIRAEEGKTTGVNAAEFVRELEGK